MQVPTREQLDSAFADFIRRHAVIDDYYSTPSSGVAGKPFATFGDGNHLLENLMIATGAPALPKNVRHNAIPVPRTVPYDVGTHRVYATAVDDFVRVRMHLSKAYSRFVPACTTILKYTPYVLDETLCLKKLSVKDLPISFPNTPPYDQYGTQTDPPSWFQDVGCLPPHLSRPMQDRRMYTMMPTASLAPDGGVVVRVANRVKLPDKPSLEQTKRPPTMKTTYVRNPKEKMRLAYGQLAYALDHVHMAASLFWKASRERPEKLGFVFSAALKPEERFLFYQLCEESPTAADFEPYARRQHNSLPMRLPSEYYASHDKWATIGICMLLHLCRGGGSAYVASLRAALARPDSPVAYVTDLPVYGFGKTETMLSQSKWFPKPKYYREHVTRIEVRVKPDSGVTLARRRKLDEPEETTRRPSAEEIEVGLPEEERRAAPTPSPAKRTATERRRVGSPDAPRIEEAMTVDAPRQRKPSARTTRSSSEPSPQPQKQKKLSEYL
jgi:hypothetical protein